jgi:GDP/UDP-N,N'-diacetylbacillosamine 2-epimerase (hydrolysing)
MKAIKSDEKLNLQIIVTGMHLSPKYGMTVNEIIEDGFEIDEKCPILLDYNGKTKNAKETAMAINQFADAFSRLKPHIILILGDRYEIFAAATTAMTMNIPIAHISGGEITEGAMDEQIRHSITKMSHIHFPGADVYAQNIINMGEESWRVFNVGEPGIENIKLTKLLSKKEIKENLGVDVDENTMLITYHPVTLEVDNVTEQIKNLIKALDKVNKNMIITYPNSDNGGDKIIEALDKFDLRNQNVHLFRNLGSLRYLSVMKHCGVIVGNSSSALIEAPFLKKPVVNIGNRQKGRLTADNIIQSSNEVEDIYNAIMKATSQEFRDFAEGVKSLYGEGNTSEEIVKILKEITIDENLLKKKLIWSV